MIDWVSIVRHSRRRFSTYVGGRAPIRMKRRRRTPVNTSHNNATGSTGTGATSPQHERSHYSCCCTQVSYKDDMCFCLLTFLTRYIISQIYL